jgi:hypothetical protein
MNRLEFQGLARRRLDEANALLGLGYFSGAYYLGGYAPECALKAVIAKGIRAEEFPARRFGDQIYTHDLTALLGLTGLLPAGNAPLNNDPQLETNWSTVKDWSEQSRYIVTTQVDAEQLLEAIADPTHGVLGWLIQHW